MMLRLMLQQKITSIYEAEQHVYAIPPAGTLASRAWTALTNEHRVELRSRAISLWRKYLDSDGLLISHPPIVVPEYRQMLTQPDGEMIVEEV
jgi:hypothetical protein